MTGCTCSHPEDGHSPEGCLYPGSGAPGHTFCSCGAKAPMPSEAKKKELRDLLDARLIRMSA